MAGAGAKRRKWGLAAGLAVLACLIALLVWRRPAAEEPPAPMPDFSRFVSPELPLDQGLVLVVVLATDCHNCIDTARLIGTFDAAAHDLRVFFILYGEPGELEVFWAEVGTTVPYCLVTAHDYAELAGENPPAMYLLENGVAREYFPGNSFNLIVLCEKLQMRQYSP